MAKETLIRTICFLGVFFFIAVWEMFSPRRSLSQKKSIRWFANLSLVVCNQALLRWIFPVTALGLAFVAKEHGWGLLHQFELPVFAQVLFSLLLFDLVIYWQHVAFHRVPFLWRVHRMHHVDLDLDVTTGSRFHPIEILLSMVIKMAVIVLVGTPPLSVLVFEVLLNAAAMFNHGNIYLPTPIDRVLRWLIVTPDMHRVHHSVRSNETHSNFGFNLPWWDRLFKTYRAQPKDGHEEMTIGLPVFREKKYLKIQNLLKVPFIKNP